MGNIGLKKTIGEKVMHNTSRRTFLGSTAVAAGAVSLGNVSGCSAPAPEKSVVKGPRAHPMDGIERENIKNYRYQGNSTLVRRSK